jgi:hypothetical protein
MSQKPYNWRGKSARAKPAPSCFPEVASSLKNIQILSDHKDRRRNRCETQDICILLIFIDNYWCELKMDVHSEFLWIKLPFGTDILSLNKKSGPPDAVEHR